MAFLFPESEEIISVELYIISIRLDTTKAFFTIDARLTFFKVVFPNKLPCVKVIPGPLSDKLVNLPAAPQKILRVERSALQNMQFGSALTGFDATTNVGYEGVGDFCALVFQDVLCFCTGQAALAKCSSLQVNELCYLACGDCSGWGHDVLCHGVILLMLLVRIPSELRLYACLHTFFKVN